MRKLTTALLFSLLSAPAFASPSSFQVSPVTHFCGDRYCPTDANANTVQRRHAVRTRTRRPSPEIEGALERRVEAPTIGSGNVVSHKTGATAHVAAKFAAIAQAVVDDLEQNYGAAIKFMGGFRRGHCSSSSLHPCGLAIDLCQTARGVVDPRCHIPSRAVEIKVAQAHGAFSGGVWCRQDRGHIQNQETAARCGSNLYAAVAKFKTERP